MAAEQQDMEADDIVVYIERHWDEFYSTTECAAVLSGLDNFEVFVKQTCRGQGEGLLLPSPQRLYSVICNLVFQLI